MVSRKIAQRYAKALINLGRQDGNYEKYAEELSTFSSLFTGVKELGAVLCNPSFSLSRRKAIVAEIAKRLRLSPITINFLHLLLDKDRIRYLPLIATLYRELADEVMGQVRAKVLTAAILTQKQLQGLIEVLQKLLNKKVIVEVEHTPSLIGGLVVNVGGVVYDGSVKTQLIKFKEKLAKG